MLHYLKLSIFCCCYHVFLNFLDQMISPNKALPKRDGCLMPIISSRWFRAKIEAKNERQKQSFCSNSVLDRCEETRGSARGCVMLKIRINLITLPSPIWPVSRPSLHVTLKKAFYPFRLTANKPDPHTNTHTDSDRMRVETGTGFTYTHAVNSAGGGWPPPVDFVSVYMFWPPSRYRCRCFLAYRPPLLC